MKKLEPEKQIVKLTPLQQELVDKLYYEQRYMLYNYALSVLKDENMAEEVVQETFRIACTKIETLLEKDNKAGWLVNVLKNVIKKAIESKQKSALYIVELFENYDIADTRQIDDNIDLLYSDLASNKDFQLIKKFVIEEKSIKEIAQEEEISISTCKQKISRARKKIRELIKKQNK